jgi:hypothetical protein
MSITIENNDQSLSQQDLKPKRLAAINPAISFLLRHKEWLMASRGALIGFHSSGGSLRPIKAFGLR